MSQHASARPPSEAPPTAALLRDRRALAGFGALLVAFVVALVALLGGGGASDAAPATGAARLAPADALVYLHVSTDGDRAGVQRALTLLRRLPLESELSARVDDLLRGSGGVPVDFARDVRPWLGGEAAIAITPAGGTTAGSLILLAVDDAQGARDYLGRTGGRARQTTYRGVRLSTYANGTVAAFVGGYLAIGQLRSVRRAVDDAAGRAGSLAADATYRRAQAGAPADRVADAYASVDGVRRLLAPAAGVLGLAGTLLDQHGLRGTALALSARDGRARLRVHAILDGARRGTPRTFAPTLAASIPADAYLYAGFTGFEQALPRLLALSGQSGLLQRAGPLLAASGVNVGRDLLPLISSEVALTVVPVAGGSPGIVLLARTRDAGRARAALARLEPAVATLFAPAGGRAPAFTTAREHGVVVRRLHAAAGLELDYGVAGSTLAIATSPAALAATIRPPHPIAADPDYRAVIPAPTPGRTAVVFFDFSRLLKLGEQVGLTRDPSLQSVATDLQRIRAVGLTASSGESQSTAELTLEIP